MNKKTLLIIMLVSLMLLTSCGRMTKSSYEDAGLPPEAPLQGQRKEMAKTDDAPTDGTVEAREADNKLNLQERKIIKNASLYIYVENFEKAAGELENLTRQFGGIVADKSVNKTSSSVYGTFTLWVPAERLNEYTENTAKIGRVTSMDIAAEDITDEYYDLDARLKSAIKQKQKLEQIYQESKTVTEALEVQKEIERLQSDIEVMKGRKRRWDKQVSYSTVTITLNQNIQVVREPDDIFKPLRRAFRNIKPVFVESIGGIIQVFAGLIVVVIALIPWALIVYIMYLIWKKLFSGRWKKYWEKRKMKKEQKKDLKQEEIEKEKPEDFDSKTE
ncbi:MAG: DUF4349 domain-containing protein [Vulcanimicrobiota bacterium]